MVKFQDVIYPHLLKPIFRCDTKQLASRPCIGLHPQTQRFCVTYTNICWFLKTLKFALPQTRNIKFAFVPTQTLNANQWNIGCFGSPTNNVCVGHVHFMFFVLISFAFGGQRKPSGIWALIIKYISVPQIPIINKTCLDGCNTALIKCHQTYIGLYG